MTTSTGAAITAEQNNPTTPGVKTGTPAKPVSAPTATTAAAATSGSTASSSGIQGLDPTQLNADQIIQQTLASWGLGSLAPTALGYIKQGYDASSTQFLLESTPEYAARFPANATRIANGLAPLSPAEYISTEQSYRQVMAAAGLPKGFYDSNEALSGFIGNDMSPTELQDRVSAASTLVNQTDPNARAAMQQMYGIDSGHLVAHFLDQNVAAPILQKQEQAAQIGGSELAQGLALSNKQKLEGYVDQGVSLAQAKQGYQQVASVLPLEQNIAARYGQTFNQGNAEDEFVGGLASAARARQNLNMQEKSSFSGDSGLPTTLYGNTGRAATMDANAEGSF